MEVTPLLTLLIYDYTHPKNINAPFVLPNARVEFYERATEKLFHQEHRSTPQHHIGYHQVLQQLAFMSHVKYGAVLTEQETENSVIEAYQNSRFREPSSKEINLVLKALRESGLLLYDGEYKFVHSTLREYYVAKKFEQDGENLLKHFKDDPNNWEEIVKLWCELVKDSTPLIENIYETHKEIAFECLVNSQHVDRKIAKDIIVTAKYEFKHAEEKAKIVQAFGVVAADQSKNYGKEIFTFLENLIQEIPKPLDNKPTIPTCLKNVAYALSITSQKKAADLLVKYYLDRYSTCPYLEYMGDIAVLSLKERIEVVYHECQNTTEKKKKLKNIFSMLTQLAKGGNNQAIEFLIDCLWNDRLAKWCLEKFALLFSCTNVIKVMHEYPIEKCQNTELSWFWKPFQEPEGSSLPRIAGRIAYILGKEEIGFDKNTKLDPRLIIPLCAIHLREQETKLSQYGTPRKVWENLRYLKLTTSQIEESLKVMEATSKWRTLFATLTPSCQYELLFRLVKGQFPEENDWNENITNAPINYQFKTSIYYNAIKFIPNIITIVIGLLIISFFLNPPVVDSLFLWYSFWGYASIVVIGGWYYFWKEPLSLNNSEGKKQSIYVSQFIVLGVVKMIALPITIIRIGGTIILRTTIFILNMFSYSDETNQFDETTKIVDRFMKYFSFEEYINNNIPLIGWFLVISISLYVSLSSFIDWEYIVIFLVIGWLFFYFVNKLLWKKGLEKEREAQNPLAGIFQEGSKCQLPKQT